MLVRLRMDRTRPSRFAVYVLARAKRRRRVATPGGRTVAAANGHGLATALTKHFQRAVHGAIGDHLIAGRPVAIEVDGELQIVGPRNEARWALLPSTSNSVTTSR